MFSRCRTFTSSSVQRSSFPAMHLLSNHDFVRVWCNPQSSYRYYRYHRCYLMPVHTSNNNLQRVSGGASGLWQCSLS